MQALHQELQKRNIQGVAEGAALPPEVIELIKKIAQSSATPEHKKATIDALVAKHSKQGVAEGLDKEALRQELIKVNQQMKLNHPRYNNPNSPGHTDRYFALAKKKDTILAQLKQGVAEGSEKECPLATQDITLNLKNRQKAINEYGYGPLNPDLPNTKFWMKKVDEWNLDSVEEAKQSLCGNCAAFDQREDTLDCIAQGIDSNQGADDPTIEAGDLGYCRFLKFKCASRRTCDAWVTGGPLTDNKEVAERMMPASNFAGSQKNKLGPAGQWKNTGPSKNRPARAGDLVGGDAQESVGKKKGADGKACWDGYRYNGTTHGKDKCVKVSESVENIMDTLINKIITNEAVQNYRK